MLCHYKIRCILAMVIGIFSSALYAAPGHFYVGADGGASTAMLGDSNPQITYYNNNLTDAYPLNNSHNTTSMWGLNGGYEFPGQGMMPTIDVGLGFYDTPSSYNYSGQLIETASGDPSSVLYNYKFQITSWRLMAETKLLWTLKGGFTPFVDLGVGSAWNHLSNYQETAATSDGYVALPPFQSKTTNNLAYQVGAGIGYNFNFTKEKANFSHERLSLEYRYVNLGNVLSNTRGSSYPYSLNLGTLTTQEVFLNWTHFF